MAARANTVELGGASLFHFTIGALSEALGVVRFSAKEGVSSLFELQVEVACENPTIDFSEVVGQEALLGILGELGPRYFHGIVSRFEQLQDLPRYTLYRATVVPRVWRLARRQDCRIFQRMDTPSILAQVLVAEGVEPRHIRFELSGKYEPRDYCVQYRESDWDFASRLMEEDGLFFYFEHGQDSHVLVVGDDSSTLKPLEGNEVLPFRRHTGAVEREQHIQRFHFTQELRPGRVSVRDFNFKQPSLEMEASAKAPVDDSLELYDFPGEYQDPRQGSAAKGKTIARLRLEAWQATRRVGHGESDCERLVPGQTFLLVEHPREDYNGSYLVTRVHHEGQQSQVLNEESSGEGTRYTLSFACIPAEVPFRPERVTSRPHMRGVQTAVVVGPAGEEIHVDEWGRVKVQFHWDRRGRRDEHSSCWIRVSQLWAGGGWGGMFIPRIGQEVVVDFIEGDPDRPIIIGRVYNGNNPVPYELPAEKTKSTIQSNSSPGGGGYNELRFEDAAGDEQVYLQAQKDLDILVKNDKTQQVLGHETLLVKKNRGRTIEGNQTLLVKKDDSSTIEQNQSLEVVQDRTTLVKAHHTETVEIDQTIQVGNNQSTTVGTNQSIQVGADQSTQVGANQSLKVGANQSAQVGANQSTQVGANQSLKVGASQDVKVGGSQSVTVAQASTESVGLAKTLNVGAIYAVTVGAALNQFVGGFRSEQVGMNMTVSIMGERAESVNKDSHLHVKKNLNEQVDETQSLTVGKALHIKVAELTALDSGKEIHLKSAKVVIEAAEGITLKGPGGFITIDAGGVAIQGTKVLINSGGSALAGSGASPVAPKGAS